MIKKDNPIIVETDNTDLLARKISKLKQDEQKRVKYFLSLFGIETATAAEKGTQTQDAIKTGNLTVTAENAPKTPANAPQTATHLDINTLAAIAAETQARLKEQAAKEEEATKHVIWRCGVYTFTAEKAAAAVITSELFVCDEDIPQEENFYCARNYNDAANWCATEYQRYDAPFAVIQTPADDVTGGKVLDIYPTRDGANAAARARLKKPQAGKDKLVYGFAGNDYVAAVPFAVFAKTPALEYAEVISSAPAYIAARDEIAAKRGRANEYYSINFSQTRASGNVAIDVWTAGAAASPNNIPFF